jgi:hypothetical protein
MQTVQTVLAWMQRRAVFFHYEYTGSVQRSTQV